MEVNVSTNDSMTVEDHQESTPFFPVVVIVVTLGILSEILNCGMFILIIKMRCLRQNPYHFQVLMLSVSDFLTGLSNILVGPQYAFPSLKRKQTFIIFHVLLMMNGLYLSLLQTFLISLQRFTVICKENWNTILFCGKRKYVVCFGCWLALSITSCAFVSPPSRSFEEAYDGKRIIPFVYQGHYEAFTNYNRTLFLFLITSTILLYVTSVRYVSKNLRMVKIRCTQVKVIQVQMAPSSSRTNESNTYSSSEQSVQRPHTNGFYQITQAGHKKIVQTMYLVGLIIAVLILFTGPLMFYVWVENGPSELLGLTISMSGITALVNPILYGWKIEAVRKQIALLCLKIKKSFDD